MPLIFFAKYVLTSSVLRPFSQNASGLLKCAFAIFWHWLSWWGHRKGFLRRTLPWRSYLCRCHCTVEQCTTTPDSSKSSWRIFFAVKRGVLICLSSSPRSQLFLLTAIDFSCFVGTNYLNFRVLGRCLEEPMAADCWDEVWGVRVFIKLWICLTWPFLTMIVNKT